jgi:hypothetical protein
MQPTQKLTPLFFFLFIFCISLKLYLSIATTKLSYSFPLPCLSFKSSNTFPFDSNRKSSPSLLFLLGQYPENRKKKLETLTDQN